jgi:putative transposase
VVGPDERREVVSFMQQEFALSERHACDLVRQPRASHRYKRRRADPPLLSERLIALAQQRPRFGYPRLHVLLRREGFEAGRRRVYRLYREAGLKLRSKRRKRMGRALRGPLSAPGKINERWSMDFIADTLSNGRRIRALTIVDDFSKICPALEVDTSLSGERVTRALDRAIELHGKPGLLVMDNGPEFTSRALDSWAYKRGIALHWIDPGKPVQNAYVESFNGRFRDECLDVHQFATLDDARILIEEWRRD